MNDNRNPSEASIIITNVSAVSSEFTLEANQDVVINNDRIIEIGRSVAAGYTADTRIDGSGKLALPGMLDCHTHSVQQFLKGKTTDERPVVWQRVLAPYESKLTSADRYQAARLACVEMIRAGITTFTDPGTNEMSGVARAVEETGVRAVLTRPLKDRGEFLLPEYIDPSASAALDAGEKLFREFDGAANGRIRVWFSVNTPETVSPELVDGVAEAASKYGTGVHLHLGQNIDEVKDCIINRGRRPPEYLDDHGLFNSMATAAHGVYLSNTDIHLLAERGVSIVHCPTANLGAQTYPNVTAERASGINIALGNDGAHAAGLDLLYQLQLLKYVAQGVLAMPVYEPAAVPVAEALKMATINGAKAIGRDGELGSLEEGKIADIVLLDVTGPRMSPNANLLNAAVMMGSASDVNDVIIDGNLILKDKHFVKLDENQIVDEASGQMAAALSR